MWSKQKSEVWTYRILPHQHLPCWPISQLAPERSHALLHFYVWVNREANWFVTCNLFQTNSELLAAHIGTQSVLQDRKIWNWDKALKMKFGSSFPFASCAFQWSRQCLLLSFTEHDIANWSFSVKPLNIVYFFSKDWISFISWYFSVTSTRFTQTNSANQK